MAGHCQSFKIRVVHFDSNMLLGDEMILLPEKSGAEFWLICVAISGGQANAVHAHFWLSVVVSIRITKKVMCCTVDHNVAW